MKHIIYHCHAIYQNTTNIISHFDGIIDTNVEINTHERYQEIKRELAVRMDLPILVSDKIIVQSLTVLSR